MSAQPLSSREYLEQLRNRRMQRSSSAQPTAVPNPTVEIPETTQATVPPEQPITQSPPQPDEQLQSPPPSPAQPDQSLPPQAAMPVEYSRPQPEELIVEWSAPSRPFKKRNKRFYTTVAIIVVLISMILFFAGQFLPIAVVIAVAFLAYVLSSVPPDIITNRFSTYGVYIDSNLYYWEELGRFWFEERFGSPVLYIEAGRFPFRLTFLLGDLDRAEVEEFLSEILLNEKPLPTFMDRAAEWLQEKIPLDTE